MKWKTYEVDQMSLWEFNAATGGYLKAHSTEDETLISAEEAKALSASLDRPAVWH